MTARVRAESEPPAPARNLLRSPFGKKGDRNSEFERDNSYWSGYDKSRTYASSDRARARQTVGGVGGKLTTHRGKALDTTKGRRTNVSTTGVLDGGQIFAMGPDGALMTDDAHRRETRTDKRFHHSSFLGGGDVAAAGEIRAVKGQVEAISDRSGHYRPQTQHTFEAVKQLGALGVRPEALDVHLSEKGRGTLGTQRISGTELYGYESQMQANGVLKPWEGGSGVTGVEKEIRRRHDEKDDVLAELRTKTKGRRRELDKAAAPEKPGRRKPGRRRQAP